MNFLTLWKNLQAKNLSSKKVYKTFEIDLFHLLRIGYMYVQTKHEDAIKRNIYEIKQNTADPKTFLDFFIYFF